MFIVTHVWILTSNRSTVSCPFRFNPVGTLAYHPACAGSTNSAHGFSPDHFRRKSSRYVSYYALFKWWLPLSQHPYCLGKFTSFLPLSYDLGALIGGLGCFPLGHEAYPPRPDSHATHKGIRSLIRFGTQVLGPSLFSALPPLLSA